MEGLANYDVRRDEFSEYLGRHIQSFVTGERRLMGMVLLDGVNGLWRSREERAESIEWIESEYNYLYSFQNICEVLGLPVDKLRRQLLAPFHPPGRVDKWKSRDAKKWNPAKRIRKISA
jgi:hypothetical protein